MTFVKAVYKGRFFTSFDWCGECGHEFEEGETIWRRLGNENIVKEYLCQECYEKKFIDL